MNPDIFTIQKTLIQAFTQAVAPFDAEGVTVTIERPKDKSHGDFSCPIAMNLAKKLKKAPLAIAQEIVKNLKLDEAFIAKVEVVAPGFINLRLNPSVFYASLEKAFSEDVNFGKSEQGKGEKILLEFVSANPTGPLNVVNARSAALGDCAANLLIASGTEVVREYYVNDSGVQARLFAESL